MVNWDQLGVVVGSAIGFVGVVGAALKKFNLLHFGKSHNERPLMSDKCPDPSCQSLVRQTHDDVIVITTKIVNQENTIKTTKDDVKRILSSVGYIEGWVKRETKEKNDVS